MDGVTAEDMRSALDSYHVALESDGLTEDCVNMCYTLGITAKDLATKLTRYSLNHDKDILGADDLRGLQKEHNNAAMSARKSTQSLHTPPGQIKREDGNTRHSDSFLSAFIGGSAAEELRKAQNRSAKRKEGSGRKRHDFSSPTTPKRGVGQQSAPSPLSAEPTPGIKTYATREKAGEVELQHPAGAVKPEPLRPIESAERAPVSVQVYPNCVEKPYRFMFEKLLDKAEILDMRTDELSKRIVKKHKLLTPPTEAETEAGDDAEVSERQTELAHVAVPTQEPVIVAGRICSESLTESKINDQSIMLEGSRETSNGARVKLDVSDRQALPAFSLFPGQIVALEATNTDGESLHVTNIYSGAPLPKKRTTPAELMQFYFPDTGLERSEVDIMVVSGPFTTVDDLSYAPLDDFLAAVQKQKPDVVVALGPFVEAAHPLVAAGELDVMLDDLYHDIVAKMVDAIEGENTSHTKLIIIPSLTDATHDFVYPQAPNQVVDNERVFFFPNPCTFMIQELTFGCTTADVLSDVFKNETARPKKDLASVANHLIEQRSYYPLFPPEEGVNFDFAHIDNVAMPITPDVLLLPSKLRYFAKDVNGTLVVNPGRLTKFRSGGTYGHLRIDAPRRNDIPTNNEPLRAGVSERATVQIRRI